MTKSGGQMAAFIKVNTLKYGECDEATETVGKARLEDCSPQP